MQGITLKATAYKLSITVNDMFSNPVGGMKVNVFAENGALAGWAITAPEDTDDGDKKGVATLYVMPGKYTCIVAEDGLYATTTAMTEVTSSDKSVTLSGIQAAKITKVEFDGIDNPGVPVCVKSPGFDVDIPNSDDDLTDMNIMIPLPYGYASLGCYSASAYVNGVHYEGTLTSSDAGVTVHLAKKDTVTISGTVYKADNTAVAGATVVLDAVGDYHKVTADENGKYSLTAVIGSTVTLVAYNSEFAVKYVTKTVESQNMTVDFTLGTGAEKTYTINYYTGLSSPSTKTLPYFGDMSATLSIDGGDTFALTHVMTDSSGKARFVVPEGFTVKLKIGPTETDCFYIGDTKEDMQAAFETTISESSSSGSMYIQYTKPSSSSTSYGTSYLKQHKAEFVGTEAMYFNGTLKSYKDSTVTYKIENGIINEGKVISPGSYTMELDKGGKYVFDKTAYVVFYPGSGNTMTAVLTTDPFEYYTVTANGSANDTYSIETEGQYTYVDSNDNSRVYYIEVNNNATIGATDGDGKAAYATVIGDDIIDLTKKYELVTLSGNINMNSATGKVNASYYNSDTNEYWSFTTSISSGKYTFKVPGAPVGTAAFEYTLSVTEFKATDGDETTYNYTVVDPHPTVKVGDKDVTYNFGVYTSGEPEPKESEYATFTNAYMQNGDGFVKFTLKNPSENGGTFYLIDGSDGFFLEKTYAVYVDSKACPMEVRGVYNPFKDGAGSENIAINIKSADGTVLETLVIPAEYFHDAPVGVDYKVELEVAGKESETYDSVNGYSYTYSISIDNPNTFGVKAAVSASVPEGSDWTVFVSFDGYNIFNGAITKDDAFVINGYESATVSITLMSPTSFGYDAVPNINYKVEVFTLDGTQIKTEGAAASGELQHQSGSVSESSSTVDGADNSAKKISTAFYILLVLSVLVLLAFVYSANKRGVFSRK